MIERILFLMNEKGVRAYELTSALGLPNSAITKWKQGVQRPSTDAIVKLADYFGVTTDYLLGRSEDTQTPVPDVYDSSLPPDEELLLAQYRAVSGKGKEVINDAANVAEELYKRSFGSEVTSEISTKVG